MPGDVKSSGEFRKAERFKKTPNYYRSLLFAERKSPTVSGLQQKVRDAYRKQSKGQGLQYEATRARNEADLALEDKRRSGSDKVATGMYDRYTNQLWKKARPYMRLGPNRPKQVVEYNPKKAAGLPTDFAGAFVKRRDSSTVNVTAPVIRAFADTPKPEVGVRNIGPIKFGGGIPKRRLSRSFGPMGDFARIVPLHEWAHVKQYRRRPGLPQPTMEGGAEAFEKAASKKLKIKSAAAPPDYERWAKPIARRGERYSLYGQFVRRRKV